jgi:uncharacterized protein with von Willebrand factor type A (vWA) domain
VTTERNKSGDREPGLPGGIIHSYQQYDPKSFPSPTAPPPDLASAAMEHMLAYGSLRDLTPEELAEAVHLDPSMFPSLGPSLGSLIAMLEERKKEILARYDVEPSRKAAAEAYRESVRQTQPPKTFRGDYERAAKSEQIRDLERLYEAQKDDTSAFAGDLMGVIGSLADKYQIEQLSGRYAFTGREAMSVPEAIDIKDELETIDELLAQLHEAMKSAKLAIIDLEALSAFAEDGAIENINDMQRQIEDYLRAEMERQGIERSRQGLRLTPQAMKLFQGKVLQEIFSDLQAARSGRHVGPIAGEGVVELAATKQYEFGDSVANMDVPQSFVNAMLREARGGIALGERGPGVRMRSEDMVIHKTRNSPKCATCVLMDMSGSMRYGGQYIHVKRMALAFDALIRSEYPGDFLQCIEMYTFAKPRHPSELAALMPRMVSIHTPVVRLRADMSDPNVSGSRVPQHFTNIQRSLQLSRRFLSAQDTPNRQILLITDGLPTAHFENEMLYMLYPPDPRTEEVTMREARACQREGITINIFLLPSWSQSREDIQFAQRIAETTKGRVFFTGGSDIDRFVLWDYVSQRRKIIG